MYSNSKDQKAIEEAYKKMFLTEEEDPSEYNSKYYDPNYKNWSNKVDDFEFEHEGRVYMAEIVYDIEEIFHAGDYDTPDDYDYDVKELDTVKLFRSNPETQDWDEITKEQNPEEWEIVSKIGEQKFFDDRSNWDPEY